MTGGDQPEGREASKRVPQSALASLVASLLVCPLPLVGGALGILLGRRAQRAIHLSRGTLRGRELATAGVVIGVMHIVFVVIGVATALMVFNAKERIARIIEGPLPTHIGAVTRVVLPSQHPFAPEIARQELLARQRGESLLMVVVTDECVACRNVIASLGDPAMQSALAQTRWVEVSATEYGEQLRAMGVPLELVPGFVLLQNDLSPRDYIHGGEWKAYLPMYMAPILSDFVQEEYSNRRDPWPGRPRADETPL